MQKDARGRRYRLYPIPKTQATRIDDAHVRTMIGAVADLEREDAENFYIRLYEPPPGAAPSPPAPPPPAPAPAAGPLPPTAEESRIRLVDFGRGLPRNGQWREGFGIGDLNRDGHPDLVFPPPRKSGGAPVIFLGDGQGGWTRWREARFPPLPYDYGDAQVADLDGDGIADIALAMHYRGIVALLGDGRGNFRLASDGLDYSTRTDRLPEYSSRCLRAFDADGDGRADLVVLGEGPILPFGGAAGRGSFGVVVYENGGAGRWRPRREPPRLNAPFGSAMAVGDFNGDGRLDVAVASGLMGSREIVAFAEPGGSWRWENVDPLPPEGYFRAIAAVDLDGDGVDDLIVGGTYLEGETWVPRLDAFLSRDKGKRWDLRPLERGDEITAVAAASIAGNGAPIGIAATSSVGKLLFFVADGRGKIERIPVSLPGTGCSGSDVQLADLDGDGRVEIVSSYGEETAEDGRCGSQGMICAFKIDFSH